MSVQDSTTLDSSTPGTTGVLLSDPAAASSSTCASATAGPSAIARATARLSATTGEGVIRVSRW